MKINQSDNFIRRYLLGELTEADQAALEQELLKPCGSKKVSDGVTAFRGKSHMSDRGAMRCHERQKQIVLPLAISGWLWGAQSPLGQSLTDELGTLVKEKCAFGWLAHSRNVRLRLFTEDTRRSPKSKKEIKIMNRAKILGLLVSLASQTTLFCLSANIAMAQTTEVKNLTSAEYQKKFDQLTQAGFRPVKVWSKTLGVIDYTEGEHPRFGYWATFQKVPGGPPWVARHGIDAATYQQEFNKWTQAGYMPTDINVACVGSDVRYCVIYDKIANPPAWVARHGINNAAFQNENASWTAKGYHLKLKTSCQSPSGQVYAALWQK